MSVYGRGSSAGKRLVNALSEPFRTGTIRETLLRAISSGPRSLFSVLLDSALDQHHILPLLDHIAVLIDKLEVDLDDALFRS